MRVFSSVPGSMNENVINRAATMRIRLKNLKVRSFVTQHLLLLLEYNSIQCVEDQEVNVTIGELPTATFCRTTCRGLSSAQTIHRIHRGRRRSVCEARYVPLFIRRRYAGLP